jgi:WD40 repeat protein
VHFAAFSSDGREVVAGFGFEIAELWDARTGERRAVYEGHSAALGGCVYAASGREIVTWAADRTVRRWDRGTGRLLATYEKHADMVTGCALSPDGSTCFSAGRDGTLELWDSSKGARAGTRFPVSSQPETACAFSPEGTQLLSVSGDRTLSLWDRATGRLVRTFTGHEATAVACAFSPDGRTIASGSVDGKVMVWDRASGRPLATFDARSGVPAGATISYAPGSGEVLSIHADGVLRVWTLGTPLPFEAVFPGFASDPVGSARRALHGISFRGTPRAPEPGDLPAIVRER